MPDEKPRIMGVPRFMSDLLPYAKTATLGEPVQTNDDRPNIRSVIIDGPSVIYYVYNKLVAYRAHEAGTGAPRLPVYSEIIAATEFFLSELTAHEVKM